MNRTLKLVWAFALLLVVCPAFAVQMVSHAKPRKHRRQRQHKPTWFNQRVFVPSHDNLMSQNAAIDVLGLERIRDKRVLQNLVDEDILVPITDNQYVRVSPKLERDRRFCRPWVDIFLQELGMAYYEQFQEPIQVNSAVRTVKTQMWLLRWNHNAAPWHGEAASAHLAGVAVDLQRRGLTRAQIHFIQKYLLYLVNQKMVIVEEELKQPCFHIVVTGEYPYPPHVKFPMDTKPLDLIFSNEVPHGFADDNPNPHP